MFRKNRLLMIILFLFITCNISCGNKGNNVDNTLSPAQNSTYDSEMSLTETDNSIEEIDESSFLEATKEITETEQSDEESEDGMTNRQFLRLINDAFGIYSDESFEDDVKEAKLWNIIDADAEIDENGLVTPEFLISVTMIATGYVDNTALMNDILNCAVKYKVIEKADISSVEVNNAYEIVESAKHAWLYPEMYE